MLAFLFECNQLIYSTTISEYCNIDSLIDEKYKISSIVSLNIDILKNGNSYECVYSAFTIAESTIKNKVFHFNVSINPPGICDSILIEPIIVSNSTIENVTFVGNVNVSAVKAKLKFEFESSDYFIVVNAVDYVGHLKSIVDFPQIDIKIEDEIAYTTDQELQEYQELNERFNHFKYYSQECSIPISATLNYYADGTVCNANDCYEACTRPLLVSYADDAISCVATCPAGEVNQSGFCASACEDGYFKNTENVCVLPGYNEILSSDTLKSCNEENSCSLTCQDNEVILNNTCSFCLSLESTKFEDGQMKCTSICSGYLNETFCSEGCVFPNKMENNRCVLNCEHYSNYGLCKVSCEGFVDLNNYCFSLCKNNQLLIGENCEDKCPENYEEIGMQCKKCTHFYDRVSLKCVAKCGYKEALNGSICESCLKAEGKFVDENGKCIDSCDSYLIEQDEELFCMEKCSAFYASVEGYQQLYCVSQCPDTAKYFYEGVNICLSGCNGDEEYFQPYQSSFICVSECETQIAIQKVCQMVCPDDLPVRVWNANSYTCIAEDDCGTEVKMINFEKVCHDCLNGYPYFSQVSQECVSECNDYVNDNFTCLESCDKFYDENKKCVETCPNQYQGNSCVNCTYYKLTEVGQMCLNSCNLVSRNDPKLCLDCSMTLPYKNGNSCVLLCATDYIRYTESNVVCVSECDSFEYIDGDECVKTCEHGARQGVCEADGTCLNQLCLPTCAAGLVGLYNGSCVSKCASGIFNGLECVPFADTYVYEEHNGYRVMTTCTERGVLINNECRYYSCDSAKLQFEESCVDECPDGYSPYQSEFCVLSSCSDSNSDWWLE